MVWVENDTAPDEIIATTWANDATRDEAHRNKCHLESEQRAVHNTFFSQGEISPDLRSNQVPYLPLSAYLVDCSNQCPTTCVGETSLGGLREITEGCGLGYMAHTPIGEHFEARVLVAQYERHVRVSLWAGYHTFP